MAIWGQSNTLTPQENSAGSDRTRCVIASDSIDVQKTGLLRHYVPRKDGRWVYWLLTHHIVIASAATRRDPIGIEINELLHHLVIRNDGRGEHGLYSGGGLRTFVACSNAYAYRINAASLNAPPVNEILTGRSATYPEGTEMLPYPETAA